MILFTYTDTKLSHKLGLVSVFNLILAVGILFFTSHRIATAQTVQIPDLNLRAALELALGKSTGDDITQADMASLQSLDASRCRSM